jgi:hypothetical protein
MDVDQISSCSYFRVCNSTRALLYFKECVTFILRVDSFSYFSLSTLLRTSTSVRNTLKPDTIVQYTQMFAFYCVSLSTHVAPSLFTTLYQLYMSYSAKRDDA